MNSERLLPAGTTMFFGVPANPMPEIMIDAIGQVVSQVPGIVEAYLVQCIIEGDDTANQVLVLGVKSESKIPKIMNELMWKMALVLPEGEIVDMMPYQISSLPNEARIEECRLNLKNTLSVIMEKPWWKFW